MAIKFARESLSLARPAWDSLSLISPSMPEKTRRFAFIRTIHAVYDRVEIVKESSESIHIQFLGRVKDERGKLIPRRVKEVLRKKGEIIVMRNYTD